MRNRGVRLALVDVDDGGGKVLHVVVQFAMHGPQSVYVV